MAWFEMIKEAINAAQKADNIPLLSQLLEMQKEMQEMQQENFDLKKEIAELKEAESHQVEYNELRSAVYEIMEDGSKVGPYCTRCWEVDKKLVSVHLEDRSAMKKYKCPNCKMEVTIEKKKIDTLIRTPEWDR